MNLITKRWELYLFSSWRIILGKLNGISNDVSNPSVQDMPDASIAKQPGDMHVRIH